VKNNKDGTGIVSEPPASGGTYVPPVIPVSAISIDQEDQLLEEGSILQLTTTISPANATNKKVTWASSDNTVVTVDNSGKVTAIGKGTATITVTTEDGNKTDTITITVPIVVQDVESLKKAIQEDADDGDTIVLRAGKYQLDETLVITKSVKILGPQANVDPRPSKNSPRTNDNNEAILTGDKGDDSSDPASQEEAKEAGWLASIFEIRANDVVINGLTLERTYNHIIYSQTADPTGGDNRTYDITGLQILNNIVRHGRGNEGIKIGRSINALVQYNYVYDILHPGDAIEAYDVKGFRILDNEIDGCSSVNGNIRVSNRAGGEPGIVRGNIIKNTEYHFAINAEDGSGDTVIDNNLIENAKAGGIFVYKNRSISEDTPMVIEITNNIINNYATNPVQGTDYKEKYLREAASAIAVSYNLREGIQPIVIITGNITSDGAENIPVLALGGGTTDTQAIPTDLSRITVNGNTFDKLFVKYIKVSNNNELDLLSDNTWPETQKVYNFTKGSVHDTIQTAIDEASEGDTIVVGPGTYKEEIHIEKQIKLIGTGIGKTILSAKDENSRHIIWLGKTGSSGYGMDLSGTVIKGFTINSPEKAEKDISSIYLTAKGTKGNEIIIEGNEFLGQDNQQSIAVLTPYSPNIKHVKVVGNQISTAKYGMYFNSMDNIEVIGNTIENTRYSGIIFYGKADYPCDNIIIKDNEFKNIASAEDGYDPIY
ncbi:MAG: hypothetical protein GX777_10045, partial [Fastidiosipila sp.]|nr:hypothetical protein [Fastidiosipila sp.]